MDTQASRIIDLFGGIRPLARKLDIPHTTVQRWKDMGFVPTRRISSVLELARDAGVRVGVEHLIVQSAAKAPKRKRLAGRRAT